MATVMKSDPAANVRQVGAISLEGSPAAWTGTECTDWCGHRVGTDYSVQGNMLTGAAVIEALSQ